MSTTAEQMRSWDGPTLLTYGFRPFFLGGGLWAVCAMLIWIAELSGGMSLPTAFDPVSWHAHAFLFGYLTAVIAGFLLTAVPNWTGRLPVVGWPLGGLVALWIIGRLAVSFSANLPAVFVAVADLAMPVALAGVIAREIIVGQNWRNLIVLAMLAVFTVANALFHWDAARGVYAAQGVGMRLGLGAAVMMIAVIGGRIVPSFTRNWLAKQGAGRLPTSPMQRFDKAALLVLLAALLCWVIAPGSVVTGGALLLAGGMHLVRLTRWAGDRTLSEPLVAVLHLAYAFVPLGAVALGVETLAPGVFGMAGAQHLWMAGAVGLMTLAVMTRATLGHTGQTLHATPGTTALYAAIVIAVLARLAAGLWPSQASWLHMLAGAGWLAAFGGFALLYGPLLLLKPPQKKSAS
ncbi:NnrS family protein [Marivita sp. S6314]|uniref:NnrS family protein n=1 Tax=Marivita sp. S6314 TaxID=2926406 RepID=UPI001FF18A57|nr:NnrS family protein [Marivita sp. S6314]MCK0150455.1 NnrS family protein [Marivita sp. S6314]